MTKGHDIAVIGAGYVGLTTAVCLAHLGHRTCCSDVVEQRIDMLSEGEVPIVEDRLAALLREGLVTGHLSFTNDNAAAVTAAEFVILCVPTPQGEDGRADLRCIEDAARAIGPHLRPGAVVVVKSTVPVGTHRLVKKALGREDVAVASNPEFLREGTAVLDFLMPDRVVIGADDEDVALRVGALYASTGAAMILTDPSSAETIKYAANAFLATKLSFANAIAAFCESVGADVRQVARGVGADKRIGPQFLNPGPGWGGSCFPKDTAALLKMGEDAGYEFTLLRSVVAVNEAQQERVAEKVRALAGGSLEGVCVAILGLTFKARTDDTRCSPAVQIAGRLARAGAKVKAYDPVANSFLPDLEVCLDPYSACEDASVLLLATEWEEFRWLDYVKIADLMLCPVILDSRNLLDPATMRQLGFEYQGMGVRP